MKKEEGLSIIALVIIIVILIIIAGVLGNKIFGKDGIIDKFRESDNEYNKAEIVDELNLMVKEKYVLDYKYSIENNKDPNELCNSDKLFQYLLDNGVIEQLKDIKDNLVQDQYYINPEKLHNSISTMQINENGSKSNGTKIFKIKKLEDKYMIYFVDKYGEEEELGELVFNPEK